MTSHESYLNLGRQRSTKFCHPAAERNKDPILQVLQKYIDPEKKALLLEISSGSGQHVAHFAPHFPNTVFQPTEFDKTSLPSIVQYVADSSCENIRQPQFLDVRDPVDNWLDGSLKDESLDYMLNINMIHISEWACAQGLFRGAGRLLKPEGLLFTYGPYAFSGTISPQSNVDFDRTLQSRNPAWGLRDIHLQLEPLARSNHLHLVQILPLPANNHFVVWRKS